MEGNEIIRELAELNKGYDEKLDGIFKDAPDHNDPEWVMLKINELNQLYILTVRHLTEEEES